MRVVCRHGHFSFYPVYAGEISRFVSFFGTELERDGDFFTFPLLKGAPDYSLAGKDYLGIPAVKTFEGTPWEVMRENGFVYSLATNLLVPKQAITIEIDPVQTEFYYIGQTIFIQPGSYDQAGSQVLSYDAHYVDDLNQLRISEFSYE